MENSESLAPKTYTLKDISKAIAMARQDIIGIPQHNTVAYRDVGDPRIHSRVISAQQKARKESGSEWKQNREYGGPIESDYDASHATGILDALKERATGKNAVVYEKEGLTPAVIDRAEELLFGKQ